MSTENIDFTALLANMEAKRAALDAAIASIRAAIVAGALGGAVGDLGTVLPNAELPLDASVEIPTGAFLGKSVSEAIKAYLAVVKRKQTTREIVEALKRGGIESGSSHFTNIVYNGLGRMHRVTGEIAKLGKYWGLAEWVHPGMRSAPAKAQPKRARGDRRGQKRRAKGVDRATLPSRMEEFLASHQDKTYTPTEIAHALGVKPIAVNVRLKRLVERGRIAKVGAGQYRAAKTGVIKMPAAG